MKSIIINKRTPEDYSMDDIIEFNYIIANTNIDIIQHKIKYAKPTMKREIFEFLKSIRPDKNSIEIDDISIKWKVKPNIKFKEILEKHFIEGLENVEIDIRIEKDVSADTEVFLTINEKPFKINEDGSMGIVDIRLGGLLKF